MILARTIAASVFVSASIPFLAFAQTANLIQNPGFESGSGSAPTGWVKTYWGSPVPTFKYPDAGRNGNGASVTLGANSSGDARWAHSPVVVEPNATYAFTSWYKSNVATEVNIEFTASNGAKTYSWFANVPSSSNTWKQFTGSIKVPSNATKMVVFHLLDKQGTLVVDDYSLTKGGAGTTTPPGAPTVTFTANPTSITAGQSSTLTWSSTNATSCTASGAWSGAKAISGTQSVTPSATATYSITCTGASGTTPAGRSVTVTVNAAPSGGFSEGMISFTFDDSWTSQYTNVVPVLQTAGFKGTFYLTTQPIQEAWDTFMTPNQVKDIAGKGHEIAGHTVTHADLTTLSQTQVNNEIKNSKTYLQNLTGKAVTSFAYPYGALNTTVKSLLQQAGYTSARGIEYDTRNTASTDKYNLKSMCIETSNTLEEIKAQIDAAKAQKQWFVLCIHEVKSGGDQWTMTPAKFQEIVNYVKQTGIKVVTVQQGRALMQ
jgi:peptidoglycan/xylan/chitin deacetylase (PgdA/CDA1 family)